VQFAEQFLGSEVVPAEHGTHAFRQATHICSHLAAANLPRNFLEARFAHFSEISLNHDGTHKHCQESDKCQTEVHLQRCNNPNKSGDPDDRSPLDVPQGMAIQAGFPDFAREFRVGVIELLLYLMEYALFVVRERHETFRSLIPTV
tara:strand:- start:115 stop:552 length:438 start_codon:yes stop_codon:yes gene_type:complete